MKFKSLISMMAVAAIVFAGCAEKLPEPEGPNQEQPTPEPEPIVGEITLKGEESLTFSCEGGSQNVAFEATLEWTATASEEFVTVGPESGEAGDNLKITVSVPEYEGYDDRTATVTLTCGDDIKTIQVTQKKKGALVLAPSTIQVPAEGKSLSIVVQANSNVTAAIVDDAKTWISELKGLVDYGFTFVIAPNEAVESRTGQIVFTNETGETETITLEQAGTPIVGKITLQGEDAFTVSDEGGQLEVAFNATLGWTASSSEEFVTVEPKTGEAGDVSVTLTVAENDSYDPRTATVTLTCDEDVKTIEITQKQKGALLMTENALDVAVEGGVVNIVAKANSDVTAAIAEDAQSWITRVELKGLVDYNFSFNVAANESDSPRTGQIVFSNETGTETVTITQAGKVVEGKITLKSEESLSVLAEGGSQEISFEATLAWTASASEDFVLLVPTSGEAGEAVVTATVGVNEATEPRTAMVTLTCGEDVKNIILTQEAAAPTLDNKCDIEDVGDLIEFATKYNANELDPTVEVTLMNDIVFDAASSAEYAATGGIGVRSGDNAHYFNGVFNGNNKTIKGYTANIPLFAAVDTYGTVKDFTIDNTSSFTFDAATLDEMGTVAGYHKGLMQNVIVDANITFAAAAVESAKQIGGLCARVREGKVENSTYTGHISVPSTFSASAAKIYIGGITGWISNAAGIITNTQFKGSIDFEGHVASDDRSNPYLMLGGIAGSNSGTVSNCEVFGDKTFTTTLGTYSYDNATIANRSTKSYFTVEGGVVGINAEGGKVENCVNRANIMNFVLTTGTDGTAADANSRYIFGGGIAGYNNNGEVSGCTNYGYIFSRSTPRLVKFGGIVGRNEGSVANCVNETSGSITIGTAGQKPYSARLPYVGGIIGENTSAAVSNVQNKAPIKISRIEDATGSEIRVGGVLGSTTAEIDGTSAMNISNSGAIAIENGISSVTLGLFEGGVVGYTTASVKNVKNTGALSHKQTTSLQKLYLSGVVGSVVSAENVEISGCENEGEVFFNAATASASGSVEYTENFVGGVLAATASNVTVSSCKNAGYVHGGNSTKLNGKTLYMGGVVGQLKGQSSIKSCVNTGTVYNDTFNNSNAKELSVYAGGVAGFVEGTADNKIAVTDCSVTTVDKGTELFGHRRGYSGGIVAYAEYATISDCTSDRNFNGSAYYLGGIAGWVVNSTISNCDWTGTSITSSQMQGAGGIVARLGAGSVVDSCNSYLETTLTKGGTIAGVSEAGSTIKNCHYKATSGLGVCSDSNAAQEGNSADL